VRAERAGPARAQVVDDVPWCKGCHLEHRVARCFACARPAEGGVVTEVFPGRTWHEECFACRQCNSQLLGSFRHHGDELWCKRCYDEHKAPRCAACARPAEGGVTTSAFPGKVWHEDCFACKGCAAVLRGSFKHKDATLWCAPCYTDKFLPRCTACTKPVEGSVMTVSEATYHPACLVCGACKVQLGAKMFRHDGQLLCTPCYEDVALKKYGHKSHPAQLREIRPGPRGLTAHRRANRCAKCARPIRDATWPEYRGGSYHPSCFCCATCHKPVKGSFYEQDGGKGVVAPRPGTPPACRAALTTQAHRRCASRAGASRRLAVRCIRGAPCLLFCLDGFVGGKERRVGLHASLHICFVDPTYSSPCVAS